MANRIQQASASRRILMLRPTDEMRHPYETALQSLGREIRWFSSLVELLAYPGHDEPLLLVIDLDCLKIANESSLAELRSNFPGSELIALSSSDSAQLALQCIRAGFTDFLLKPVSPEELAWAIRKCLQRHEAFVQLDPRNDILRAISQISTASSPNLARLAALEYLSKILGSQCSAWIRYPSQPGEAMEVMCALPKSLPSRRVLNQLPRKGMPKAAHIYKMRGKDSRKILLPCDNPSNGMVLLWGISGRVGPKLLSDAGVIVQHLEISLSNLEKFDQVKQQTFVDDLTGLYNSRYLKFAISNAIMKCKLPGQAFSVLFIDVDHFKQVNDGRGHLIGSAFLIAIGKTIKSAVRNIDPVFRYGGDEFVVVLQETDLQGAQEIAERIRKNIERRVYVVGGQRLQTTVSVGVATYPLHAVDRDTLLKLADEAMYSAKRQSRNAVHLAVDLPEKSKRAAG